MNNTKRHLTHALLAVCLLATASPLGAAYTHYLTERGVNEFAVARFFEGTKEARWVFKGQDVIAVYGLDRSNWSFLDTLKADGSTVWVFHKTNGSIYNIAYYRYNPQGVLTNVAAFNNYTSHVPVSAIADNADRTVAVFADVNSYHAWYFNADGTVRAQFTWGHGASAGNWFVDQVAGDLIATQFHMYYLRINGGIPDMLAVYTFDYNGNWTGVRAYTV